jgi:hypothetical protein
MPSSMPGRWRFEDGGGADAAAAAGSSGVALPDGFPTQSDAESWLGEVWRELSDAGVAQVTLLEAGREVYGPMSLSAE